MNSSVNFGATLLPFIFGEIETNTTKRAGYFYPIIFIMIVLFIALIVSVILNVRDFVTEKIINYKLK